MLLLIYDIFNQIINSLYLKIYFSYSYQILLSSHSMEWHRCSFLYQKDDFLSLAK